MVVTVNNEEELVFAVEESNATLSTINMNEEKAEPTFVVEEGGVKFDESKVGQYSSFKEYDPLSGNDYHLL